MFICEGKFFSEDIMLLVKLVKLVEAISILAENLNSGRSYLITAVYLVSRLIGFSTDNKAETFFSR